MSHRRTARFATIAAIAVLFLVLAPAPVRADELQEVLAAFDEAQESLRTLSASFVQTTSNPMLKDPIRAEGRFYMTKPNAIRWEYNTPEQMSFVIADDRYTGYYPARKRAERKNVKRYSEKIFRYFGMGQQSPELSKSYHMRLTEPQTGDDTSHVLILEPKKGRARKKVKEVRFWLDRGSYLPMKVEYFGKDGSTRVIEFDELQVNPDLSAALYQVEIPSDVVVTTGFSGIPNINGESQR
jgi:outer membrane lipoprotein-sorting protein